MRIVLFFALPRELREISKAGRRRIGGLPFKAFSLPHPCHTVIAAETGIGVGAAGRVFQAAEAQRPEAVVSLGYCGALTNEARVGDLVFASSVCLVSERNVETIGLSESAALLGRLPACRSGTFLTLAVPMRKRDVLGLVPSGAPLPVCDMETFALARLSSARGLPFYALRAVSDGAADEIAFDPRALCDGAGLYSPWRALLFFLARPGLLPHAVRLGKGSKAASLMLASALDGLLRIL